MLYQNISLQDLGVNRSTSDWSIDGTDRTRGYLYFRRVRYGLFIYELDSVLIKQLHIDK
jgi:hypothetical protein